MMQIMKRGRYRSNQDSLLTEEETGYMLEKLWFDVTICYSSTKSFWEDYIYNPTVEKFKTMIDPRYHHFIQGNQWVDQQQMRIQDGIRWEVTDTRISKEVFENQNIKKIFEIDILKIIQQQQGEWVLFLLWLDWFTLHNESPEEWESWGHIVLSTGIEGDDVVVYDPGPPIEIGVKRSCETVVKAMKEMGDYCFLIIKEQKNEIQDQ